MPFDMIEKQFLKDVLAGKKDLLPMDDVKFVYIPEFDELSVKNINKRAIE